MLCTQKKDSAWEVQRKWHDASKNHQFASNCGVFIYCLHFLSRSVMETQMTPTPPTKKPTITQADRDCGKTRLQNRYHPILNVSVLKYARCIWSQCGSWKLIHKCTLKLSEMQAQLMKESMLTRDSIFKSLVPQCCGNVAITIMVNINFAGFLLSLSFFLFKWLAFY